MGWLHWKMAGPADADEVGEADIFYVSKTAYASIKGKLAKSPPEDIGEDDVNELTNCECIEDEAIMIPVDMRGVEGTFDDVEELVTKLGLKGTAEAFIKAREYFEANKDGETEEERAQEMTAKAWREILNDDDDNLEA